MSQPLPSVTVLIPAPPSLTDIKALAAAKLFDYPPGKLQVLVARGRQPSIQRNTALRQASGEIVYFLDDDSVARPDTLRRAVEHFRDPAVQLVGGPNICPPDAPVIERIFALVLASWLAFGPSRARYMPVGVARTTSEKELILCNMLGRRESLLALGGFDEKLYPNEENALMDELQKRGGKLIYDPALFVHRRPRRTLRAFARMLRTYGRGRAEQFRVNPTPGSALNFVPPLFVAYLVVMPFLPLVGLAPLALYAVALLAQTIALMPQGGIPRSIAAMPLMALAHVMYGFGFWRGLFTTLRPPDASSPQQVTVEEMKKAE